MNNYFDVVVVGAGPPGLAAAIAAAEKGASVLVLERGSAAGGILNQCIHSGFGLHIFGEQLTGPEYAGRFARSFAQCGAQLLTGTTVLSIDGEKTVRAINAEHGVFEVKAGAIVLATGCRERTRHAIKTPGTRPAGVLTAGTAQYLMNISGLSVGKRVVILGSGDIGLIMARRLMLEGAQVLACVEINSFAGGLARNINQCLYDFDIPLLLSHTVTCIHGRDRLAGVSVAQVDEQKAVVAGSEQYIECDTLLLSVGLIPENELANAAGVQIDPRTNGAAVNQYKQTSIDGIFACGNALHVHDLVDYVTREAQQAGESAASYALNKSRKAGGAGEHPKTANIVASSGVAYTVPQQYCLNGDGAADESIGVYMRAKGVYKGARLVARCGGQVIFKKSFAATQPSEMIYVELERAALRGDVEFALEQRAEKTAATGAADEVKQ